MVTKIFDGLYGFIWQDYRQNNCNSYLIDADKRILIDPGHSHLFSHVEQGLLSLRIDPLSIDLVLITHAHPDHMEASLLFKKPTMLTMSETDFAYLRNSPGTSTNYPYRISFSGRATWRWGASSSRSSPPRDTPRAPSACTGRRKGPSSPEILSSNRALAAPTSQGQRQTAQGEYPQGRGAAGPVCPSGTRPRGERSRGGQGQFQAGQGLLVQLSLTSPQRLPEPLLEPDGQSLPFGVCLHIGKDGRARDA